MNLTELIWQFYHFCTICYEFYKKLKLEINSKPEPPGSKFAVSDLGQKQGTEQGRTVLAGWPAEFRRRRSPEAREKRGRSRRATRATVWWSWLGSRMVEVARWRYSRGGGSG